MGETNTTLPWLLPGPSQVPSAHHRSISTSPEETQRVLGKQGNANTQCRDTISTPASPGLSQVICSPRGWGTPHTRSSPVTSQIEGGPCPGVQCSSWGKGEEHFGIAQGWLWRGGTSIRERDGFRWFWGGNGYMKI